MSELVLIVVYLGFLALLAVAPQDMMQILLGLSWLFMLGAVLFSATSCTVAALY
jgi:hypothetical protein